MSLQWIYFLINNGRICGRSSPLYKGGERCQQERSKDKEGLLQALGTALLPRQLQGGGDSTLALLML